MKQLNVKPYQETRCKVCRHPQLKQIEKEITQGLPHTQIAARYGMSNQSVRNHAMNHLPPKLVDAVTRADEQHADDILGGITDLLNKTKIILETAERKQDNRLALDAIREARATYELLSKIAVKLAEYSQGEAEAERRDAEDEALEALDALTTPELHVWSALQAKILSANPQYLVDDVTARFVELHYSEPYRAVKLEGNGAAEAPHAPARAYKSAFHTKAPQDAPDALALELEPLELGDLSDDWDDWNDVSHDAPAHPEHSETPHPKKPKKTDPLKVDLSGASFFGDTQKPDPDADLPEHVRKAKQKAFQDAVRTGRIGRPDW